MPVKSYSRGHEIVFIDDMWLYKDTMLPVYDVRACIRCKKYPTVEGYDACLGTLKNVKSACCGHGIEKGYIIKEK